MAEYLNISNENMVTVIDDKYSIPKLLARVDVVCNAVYPPRPEWSVRLLPKWEWQGAYVIKRAPTIRGLGFDYDDTDTGVEMLRRGLMVFGRTKDSFDQAFSVEFSVDKTTTDGVVEYFISVRGVTFRQNHNIEIVLYAFNLKIYPSKIGLHIFNESGDLLFDALRAPLQNIGVLEGVLNMGASIARTYSISTPTGLDSNNIFISARSVVPYYSSIKISSGGVKFSSACYAPRMSYTSTGIYVEMVKLGNTDGSTATTFGGYYENVIYVPQGSGIYL